MRKESADTAPVFCSCERLNLPPLQRLDKKRAIARFLKVYNGVPTKVKSYREAALFEAGCQDQIRAGTPAQRPRAITSFMISLVPP